RCRAGTRTGELCDPRSVASLGRPRHLAAPAAFCLAPALRLRSTSPRRPEPGPRARRLRGCRSGLTFPLAPPPPAPAGLLAAGAPRLPRRRLGAPSLHDDVQMARPLADAVGPAERTGAEPLQRRPLVGGA